MIVSPKIARALSEARRISNLDDLSSWITIHVPRVLSDASFPTNARVAHAEFRSQGYTKGLPHHRAKDYTGLPLAPPGQPTPVLGVTATLIVTTEGGLWWTPDFLVQMAIFPHITDRASRPRGFVHFYEVVLRGDEWTALAVMQRLKS